MSTFYKRLSYSIGNEDWQTEQEALAITPTDRLLSITASGDRPLNLLYSNCQEIISVDANPFQTALCNLKKGALETLDYEEYLAFLGATESNNRVDLLRKVEKNLDPESRLCWQKHETKIKSGVLYQGAIEKWCKRASFIIRAIDGKKINRLFAFDTLHEQREFIEKNWNSEAWKGSWKHAKR